MTVIKTILESVSICMFPDGRLNVPNAATYLGLEQKTLAMMRSNGRGPKFIKRGRIFYYKEDLDAWLNAAVRCTSASQSMLYRKQFEMNVPPKSVNVDLKAEGDLNEKIEKSELLTNITTQEGNYAVSK
jgi:predicted DNA-binding transcriptional regulator AlpA